MAEEAASATPLPGPRARPVRCAGCGGAVDPLRAARVAIYNDRFRYFCSAKCRDQYDPSTRETPLPQPRRRRPSGPNPEHVVATRAEAAEALDQRRQVAALADVGAAELRPPLDVSHLDALELGPDGVVATHGDDAGHAAAERPDESAVATPTDVGSLLLALAVAGGMLSVALSLAGSSSGALSARLVVAAVASAALIVEAAMGRRDPTEAHPAALLAAPIVAAAAALTARVAQAPETSAAITLAGLVVASSAGSIWLTRRARRPLDVEREQIADALGQHGHRVVGVDTVVVRAADLRPGEEIVIEAGEVVPVDATVTAGSVKVAPWLGSKATAMRGEGDHIVAGARVIDGRARAVAAWTGFDRAWMRLTNDPRRRADLFSALARVGRLTAERAAPLAAGIAALAAYAEDQSTVAIVMFAVAAQSAFANAGVAQVGALYVFESVLAALRRGIVFRSAEALDKAGRVSVAAFCARGTLLLGEPEVANVEPIGAVEAERVLALVAGAESGASNPVATAVLRAARVRNVRPDGVRSPTVQSGLGVTAVASNGQQLVVGSRALMLKERVSVASAESQITELEAMGRSVLLVALGGRLIGVVGLQDGLRPGARAAVQHLLDVGVEPVLISGDARETCEALGRALDIEHIRPEVLPAERGDEVRRLADGGATVAVVARSPGEDVALGAADVSAALASAGSSTAEWSIQLASDDVRDAAYAIRLAHRARSEARLALTLTIAPGVFATLAVAFALAPPAIAPLASVAGTAAALFRLRAREG
jgi:P-type Cu+ transporter